MRNSNLAQTVGRLAFRTAARLPEPVVRKIQDVAAQNSPASRVIRRLTRASRTGVHAITAGPAEGMRIDLADSRPSYVLGTAEPELQSFIVEHLKPGGVFYDLGANVGYFSLVASRIVGPQGIVRAYEPLPANAAALRHNVELNGLSNLTVVEAAVSKERGIATFEEGESGQDGRLGTGALQVATCSVDDEVADGAPAPTMVKLDVEGAEHDALLGMREVLRTARPVVVCEMHTDPWELDRNPVPVLLTSLGYEVRWLEDGVASGEFWAPHVVAVPR